MAFASSRQASLFAAARAFELVIVALQMKSMFGKGSKEKAPQLDVVPKAKGAEDAKPEEEEDPRPPIEREVRPEPPSSLSHARAHTGSSPQRKQLTSSILLVAYRVLCMAGCTSGAT